MSATAHALAHGSQNHMGQLADISSQLVVLVLLPMASAIVTVSIVAAVLKFFKIALDANRIAFAGSLGLTAACCGVIAGSSEEPLVGTLATAMIGIVSAVVSYALSKQPGEAGGHAASAIVALIVVNFAAGLVIGKPTRESADRFRAESKFVEAANKDIEAPVIKDYRGAVVTRCLAETKGWQAAKATCDPSKLFDTF
jgi:hypothetical protein